MQFLGLSVGFPRFECRVTPEFNTLASAQGEKQGCQPSTGSCAGLGGHRHAPNFQREHTRYDSRSLLLGGDRLDGLPVPPGYRDSNELDLSGLTVLRAIQNT